MQENCRRRFRNLGDAIGAAGVTWRGERDFGAPIESGLRDSHVVGRDNDGIEAPCAAAAFPNVTEQRFAGDEVERFARETAGGPAGGDDAEGFHLKSREQGAGSGSWE